MNLPCAHTHTQTTCEITSVDNSNKEKQQQRNREAENSLPNSVGSVLFCCLDRKQSIKSMSVIWVPTFYSGAARATNFNIQPHFWWDCGGTFRYQFPLHKSEITYAGCSVWLPKCRKSYIHLGFWQPVEIAASLRMNQSINCYCNTCRNFLFTSIYSHYECRAESGRAERTSAQHFHWLMKTIVWCIPRSDTCSILNQIGKVWFPLPVHDMFYYYLLDSWLDRVCPRITSV